MMTLRHVGIAFALTLLAGCGGSDSGDSGPSPNRTPSASFDPALSLAANVDRFFSDLVTPAGPGAAVILVENDQVTLRQGYGMADVSAARPVEPATQFNIGSVSKQFTALAILMLYERGWLNLNDSVRNYIPELDGSWSGITIHHLLSHQAGIPDYLNEIFSGEQVVQMTNADVVAYFASHPALHFRPGQEFRYSNSGFVLAAEVVARLTGMSFREFLTAEIFVPLGMTATTVFDETRPAVPTLAVPYRDNGAIGGLWMRTAGDGGIVSTVDDMDRYQRALLAGAIVNRSTLALAFADQTGALAAGYGYGWGVGTYAGHRYVTHGGRILGFTSRFLIVESAGVVVIVLTNSDAYLNPIAWELIRSVLDYART